MDQDRNRNPGAADDFEGVAPGARVRIAYRPQASADEVELPLRMLVLGDFTQRDDARPVNERRPIAIDKDRFAEVMRGHKLEVRFAVTDTLTGEEAPLDVHLRFRRISDMEPEAIANQVPQLKALVELRLALTAIKGPLGGEKAFRNKLLSLMGDPRARRRLCEEIGIPAFEATGTPRAPAPPALPPEVVAAREQALQATRAGTLRALAEHEAPAVRAAVASNPDTPVRTLLALSIHFPEEVAHNPVLPLLAIEIPDWLSRVPARCLREIVRLGLIAAPEALLAQMAASPAREAREVAAEDPRTPPALLSALAPDRSWYVSHALLRNPSLPLATWRTLVEDPELVVRGARYPHAPVEWLREQARSPDNRVRAVIAAHPHLPADALVPLGHDGERDVRSQIARRADLPEDLARVLATDPDPLVRSQIAANPRTPVELLPAFAEEGDIVRNGLLGNRRVPAALRERVCAKNREDWRASTASTVVPLANLGGARR